MQDLQVKTLLSKLTGIRLAMPMVPGQTVLRNRHLVWHRYQSGQSAAIPAMMRGDMNTLIHNFQQEYSQYSEGFGDIVFAFYANDSSINERDFEIIAKGEVAHEPDEAAQRLSPETQKEFARVAKFITDRGVQLWWSPQQMANYTGEGDRSSVNGSNLHKKTFGYAWGAERKINPDKKMRQTQHIDPAKAHQISSDDRKKAEMQAKDQHIVKVETEEKNGRFGIFFDDGGNLFSVVPDQYFNTLKAGLASNAAPLQDDSTADKSILRELKSGVQKFFTIRSQLYPELKKEQFLPNQKRFILDSEDDPNPKPVFGFNVGAESPRKVGPAHDGRHLGNTDPNKRYIACLYNDGTMYWQKENDKTIKIPMTFKQVDSFNGWKGSYWVITNPDSFEWKFTEPEQERSYLRDSHVMNELSDFLQKHYNTMGYHAERHVASQKFQTIIIGPRFTHGQQTGQEQTIGRMSHPDTFISGLGNGTNQFIGKRGDWVVVKKEYNISSLSQQSTMPAQAVAGTGALQGVSTLSQAINELYTRYEVPSNILPKKEEIDAAQRAFDNAQKHYSTPTQKPPQPTQAVMTNAPVSPMPPQNPIPPKQIEESPAQVPNVPVLANVFNKSSAYILRKLKNN